MARVVAQDMSCAVTQDNALCGHTGRVLCSHTGGCLAWTKKTISCVATRLLSCAATQDTCLVWPHKTPVLCVYFHISGRPIALTVPKSTENGVPAAAVTRFPHPPSWMQQSHSTNVHFYSRFKYGIQNGIKN